MGKRRSNPEHEAVENPADVDLVGQLIAKSHRVGLLGAAVGFVLGAIFSAIALLTSAEPERAAVTGGVAILGALFGFHARIAWSIWFAPHWYVGGTPGRLRRETVGSINYQNGLFYIAVCSALCGFWTYFIVRCIRAWLTDLS